MKSNKSLKLIFVKITTLEIVTTDIRMFESFLNDLGLNSVERLQNVWKYVSGPPSSYIVEVT